MFGSSQSQSAETLLSNHNSPDALVKSQLTRRSCLITTHQTLLSNHNSPAKVTMFGSSQSQLRTLSTITLLSNHNSPAKVTMFGSSQSQLRTLSTMTLLSNRVRTLLAASWVRKEATAYPFDSPANENIFCLIIFYDKKMILSNDFL